MCYRRDRLPSLPAGPTLSRETGSWPTLSPGSWGHHSQVGHAQSLPCSLLTQPILCRHWGHPGGRGGRGGAGGLHPERPPGGGEEQSHDTRPLPVPGAQGSQLTPANISPSHFTRISSQMYSTVISSLFIKYNISLTSWSSFRFGLSLSLSELSSRGLSSIHLLIARCRGLPKAKL